MGLGHARRCRGRDPVAARLGGLQDLCQPLRHYQKTYGAIGGVMVALLWFYVTSLAILIGAQLDATIERASEPAPTAIIPLERDASRNSQPAASPEPSRRMKTCGSVGTGIGPTVIENGRSAKTAVGVGHSNDERGVADFAWVFPGDHAPRRHEQAGHERARRHTERGRTGAAARDQRLAIEGAHRSSGSVAGASEIGGDTPVAAGGAATMTMV